MENKVFKRIRDFWVYWKFRNITSRQMKFRARMKSRGAVQPTPGRARGMSKTPAGRRTQFEGLYALAALAALLALVNVATHSYSSFSLLDIVVTVCTTYVYLNRRPI